MSMMTSRTAKKFKYKDAEAEDQLRASSFGTASPIEEFKGSQESSSSSSHSDCEGSDGIEISPSMVMSGSFNLAPESDQSPVTVPRR